MKFRVISDIHLDLNEKHTPSFNDNTFTVVCGDTSGHPEKTIEWINTNVKNGLGVSGNHLPYNSMCPIQKLRDQLHEAFPLESNFTYLDVECGVASKEVEGILFVGSCFYSNMQITSSVNPNGDIDLNKRISKKYMNDYRYGIKEIKDGVAHLITPTEYVGWNKNAIDKFEEIVSINEKSGNPKPVVIVTHYPMVRDVLEHSFYVDKNNFPSYGNDMIDWFEKHPSIKCHCCGHCHDMDEKHRYFKISRKCGDLLVVNNSFGYYHNWHDMTFNPNRFVNTDTWEVEEIPESEDVVEEKNQRKHRMLEIMSWLG